jgi:hypothetical protein
MEAVCSCETLVRTCQMTTVHSAVSTVAHDARDAIFQQSLRGLNGRLGVVGGVTRVCLPPEAGILPQAAVVPSSPNLSMRRNCGWWSDRCGAWRPSTPAAGPCVDREAQAGRHHRQRPPSAH